MTNLSQEDLADREMNALRGGHTCGCACIKGAEFKATNYSANVADDKYSPEGNIICNWVGAVVLIWPFMAEVKFLACLRQIGLISNYNFFEGLI